MGPSPMNGLELWLGALVLFSAPDEIKSFQVPGWLTLSPPITERSDGDLTISARVAPASGSPARSTAEYRLRGTFAATEGQLGAPETLEELGIEEISESGRVENDARLAARIEGWLERTPPRLPAPSGWVDRRCYLGGCKRNLDAWPSPLRIEDIPEWGRRSLDVELPCPLDAVMETRGEVERLACLVAEGFLPSPVRLSTPDLVVMTRSFSRYRTCFTWVVRVVTEDGLRYRIRIDPCDLKFISLEGDASE